MREELPEGWSEVELRDLCEVIMGQAPPGPQCNTEGLGTIFVKAGEFSKDFPIVREWTTRPLKLARTGDVLICVVGATCGKLNLAIECAIGRSVAALRPSEALLTRALYHQLQPMIMKLRSGSTGSAQGVISKDDLERIPLCLPPLAEQQRIVGALEKLLAEVERCTEHLARIPVLLKRFRQSILDAACTGKLTVDWREENESKNWDEVTLADVIVGKPKNGYSAQPVKYKTRQRVLTLTATTSGRFDGRHFKYFDDPVPKDSHLWLGPGDILVQRGNTIEYVGVPAIYDGPPNEFIYPDLMMRLRANNRVTTKFLYFALSWDRTRNFLRAGATGTAGNMPKINQPLLMSVPISLPSLAEQQEIEKRADRLFALADGIEERFQAAKKQIDGLTQSILAKAFRGELVETEAELAIREGRGYESAPQLLEKIHRNRKGD